MFERHYYMVRAMKSEEQDFSAFFENNVVAVGWSNVDFTLYEDPEILKELVRIYYYESGKMAPQQVSRR